MKIQKSEYSKIINMYHDGVSIKDISAMYGVQSQTVIKILKQNGVQIVDKNKEFHDLYDKEIMQLVDSGYSNRRIGKKYGVDKNTIASILKQHNVSCARDAFHTNNDLNIINMYLDGSLINDICTMYNTTNGTIFNIINKHHIPHNREEFHKTCDNDIVQMYIDGYSSNEIANKYNKDHGTITKVLRKHNINIRSNSECHRKYTLNENYFDNIDTHDKAYIFGMFLADGTNDGAGRIALSLQERDVDILLKIQDAIGSNEPLNYRRFNEYNSNWSNQWRMFINNKHISEELAIKGMPKNKTFIVDFPDWLDDSLYSSLIRGLIDGDGHVGRYISLCGTYNLCYKVGEVLKRKCGIYYKLYKSQNVYDMRICRKEDIIKALEFLYKDSNLYLQRKYDKYIEITTNINKPSQSNELAS